MRWPCLKCASKRYGAGPWGRKRKLVLAALVVWLLPGAVGAETRILAFGDSLIQGFGLPASDGFVPQLDIWLRQNGVTDVEILNAGVSGDTSAGGLARIDWALAEGADAAIVLIGANDMLRGLPLDELRGNLDGILSAIDAKGMPILLASVPAVANYGPGYQTEFTRIFADLAAEHDAILYPDYFAPIVAAKSRGAAIAMLQPDGIHPNAVGVRSNVEHMGPAVLQLLERVGP